jgi:acyl-coenzyme A synthetase/AMP-(fatty) acid ligase
MAATAFLSPRLTGRPVIWDREEGRAEEPLSARVHERSEALARGLRATRVGSGQQVVILCCAAHSEDRHVALAALERLGAVPIIPVDWSAPALSRIFSDLRGPTVHLACEEGVEAWRAARGTGVMIGDGVGVMWWKALECRYADEGA